MNNYTRSGFSLIEILICLTIILIISTLAIPNLSFLKNQTARFELEKLNLAFAYLQQLAITQNKNLNLKFNNDSKGYEYQNFKEVLSDNIFFDIPEYITGPPSNQSNNSTNPITFTDREVIFYSNGKIKPGSVYLKDSSNQYLYALTIGVSQISYIRNYKFINNRWLLI